VCILIFFNFTRVRASRKFKNTSFVVTKNTARREMPSPSLSSLSSSSLSLGFWLESLPNDIVETRVLPRLSETDRAFVWFASRKTRAWLARGCETVGAERVPRRRSSASPRFRVGELCSVRAMRWAIENGPANVARRKDENGDGMLEAMASIGSVEGVQYLLEEQECELSARTMQKAAAGGCLELIEWLLERIDISLCAVVADEAAAAGHVHVLKYLKGKGCLLQASTCKSAAAHGQLECLRYLHSIECSWDEDTCFSAAAGGHLECLAFAHERKCPWDYLECLRYAHDHGRDWNGSACTFAAEFGHMNCLKYAHKHGCDSGNYFTSRSAARSGNLECLQYALETMGCSFDCETARIASGEGHLACLKYLYEYGCEWDSRTCSSAARNGHLDCLKYAHKNGCDWNPETCKQALKFDRVDCLQYALRHGCGIDEEVLRDAQNINNACSEIIRNVHSSKCLTRSSRVSEILQFLERPDLKEGETPSACFLLSCKIDDDVRKRNEALSHGADRIIANAMLKFSDNARVQSIAFELLSCLLKNCDAKYKTSKNMQSLSLVLQTAQSLHEHDVDVIDGVAKLLRCRGDGFDLFA